MQVFFLAKSVDACAWINGAAKKPIAKPAVMRVCMLNGIIATTLQGFAKAITPYKTIYLLDSVGKCDDVIGAQSNPNFFANMVIVVTWDVGKYLLA